MLIQSEKKYTLTKGQIVACLFTIYTVGMTISTTVILLVEKDHKDDNVSMLGGSETRCVHSSQFGLWCFPKN